MTRIKFEDLPSTNTPINAENLNKLNNVIVSSEEPTTGEEVWIERGKNLYNPANAQTQGNKAQNILLKYEKIKVGETYTFSTPYTWVTVHTYNSAKEIVRTFGDIENSYEQTFTIQDGEKYFTVMFYSGMNNVNLNDFDFTNVQLEIGDIATSYEPFKPKKIHTKNDNGVYEEFYNEEYVSGAILYSNTNGFTDDLTLGKDLTKYKTLEIYYKDNDNRFSSVKVNVGDILISLYSVRFANSKLYVKTGTLTITYSNGSFNLGEQRETNFSSSGTTIGTDSTGKIYITKIVGNM